MPCLKTEIRALLPEPRLAWGEPLATPGIRRRRALPVAIFGVPLDNVTIIETLRWIEQLLRWYYDPMYDYQLKQKQQRIIARGSISEIRQFLGAPGAGERTTGRLGAHRDVC